MAVIQISNGFKSSAGFQGIITAASGQLSGKVLQQCCVPGVDDFSDVGLSSLLGVRPEPKSGEQICCLSNNVGVVRG